MTAGCLSLLHSAYFQEMFLPKPPPCVMLTDKQLTTLTKALEKVHQNDGYIDRAGRARPRRTWEDQLAGELVTIINKHILGAVSGKATESKPAQNMKTTPSHLSKLVRRTIGTRSSKRIAAANASAVSPVALVASVPQCHMSLSLPSLDESEETEHRDRSYAALFKTEVARLKDGKPSWAHQRLFGEFLLPDVHNDRDPFSDAALAKRLRGVTDTRADHVWADLSQYADQVIGHQHRSVLYSFMVLGTDIRFMRWDRQGLSVTHKVDYVKDTRTFVELLLGFVVLDDASQGIDTTATLLEEGSPLYGFMGDLATGDPEALQMRVLSHNEGDVLPSDIPVEPVQVASSPSAARDDDPSSTSTYNSTAEHPTNAAAKIGRPNEASFVFQYALDYFANSLEEDWPRYRVTIGDDTFLVANPISDTIGLTGDGTRAYIAWHEQSRTFVFLKDAWRRSHRGIVMEGDTLMRLNDAGVKRVPSLICHGYVAPPGTLVCHCAECVHMTMNDLRKEESQLENGEASKGKKRPREGERCVLDRHYVHYRMATKEVCLPLDSFRSSKQLVSLVKDCVEAHAEAAQKCGYLHGDISSGNLMILPTFEADGECKFRVIWRGLLCDWELVKPATCETGQIQRRTGTWQYMSVALSSDPRHVVVIADEIESFFNVILYNALRYLRHNGERYISSFISNYFTEADKQDDGTLAVGLTKQTVITDGYIRVRTVRSRGKLCFRSQKVENEGLNSLLDNLMGWFKARYEVLYYEESESNGEPHEDTPAPELSPPTAQRPRRESTASSSSTEQEEFQPINVHDGLPRPSQDTYAQAARLETHDDFMDLLRYALTEWKWPESEVKRDQLSYRYPGPLDGMKFYITVPGPAGEKIRHSYPLGPYRYPNFKSRPSHDSRSNTDSNSL